MSIDRSLKLKDALVRHRNVLTRAERIQVLKDEERWADGAVLHLPKVAHRKSAAGKKAKAEEAAAAAAAAAGPGAPATPAAGGAAKAGGK